MPTHKEVLKKMIFSLIITALFFISTEILVRGYLCIKYKSFQYLLSSGDKEHRFKISKEVKIDYYELTNIRGRRYVLSRSMLGFLKNRIFSLTKNCLDFRKKEFSPQKKEGITRIFVFGGSAVYGSGLAPDEAIPYYLQELLGNNFEVLNCGFSGYNTRDIYYLFRYEIMNYSPDIIVIYSCYNDAFHPPDETVLYRIHEALYYRCMLYTVLLEKYSSVKYNKSLAFFTGLRNNMPEQYSKYLESTIRLAGEKRIRVILVKELLYESVQGVSRQDGIDELKRRFREVTDVFLRAIIKCYYYALQMEELANKYNAQLVDPISLMEEREEFFQDHVHLTAPGAKVLAGLVGKEILK